MQRSLDPSNQAFLAEVTAFIEANWPLDSEHITPAHHQRWRQALVARGWSVPYWPVSLGGTGWTATERFLWQQTCAACGVDGLLDDAGAAIVGPIVINEGRALQIERFLPGIRALQTSWCIGYAEPECGTDLLGMTASARIEGSEIRLLGRKTWVADAVTADWMCCLVRSESSEGSQATQKFVLVAVDLKDADVQLKPVKTLDGAATMAEIVFDEVRVDRSNLLAGPSDGGAFAQLFTTTVQSSLGRSAIAQAQLAALDESMQGFAQDDPLYTRRHAVAVDLAGLQALELRYLDAMERSLDIPFPPSVLRVKSREILLQLGALQMECFGYYALPYPDEVLMHNEGPIGPKGAVTAMRTALAQQVTALYEGSAEELKDAIARQLEIEKNQITD